MQTVVLAGALQAFHTLMSRAKTLSGPAASQAFKSAMQALDAIQSSASASYTQIDQACQGSRNEVSGNAASVPKALHEASGMVCEGA